LRRSWTEPRPFDHEGEFYRTRATYSEIRCRQQPHIPVYGGGCDCRSDSPQKRRLNIPQV
jgi:alkanesulfonate monooxygenase SsuD/methylene tetrahydromethanopterin reductase-like flavin-dependent oxidoreductase (luciferase family)